jgi:hypothetical protein
MLWISPTCLLVCVCNVYRLGGAVAALAKEGKMKDHGKTFTYDKSY